MGSRLKGAQKAGSSNPSQPRTPPTHARSNQKGWLALSQLSLPPPAWESVAGEACSKEEGVSYQDSKVGPPEPGAPRHRRKRPSCLGKIGAPRTGTPRTGGWSGELGSQLPAPLQPPRNRKQSVRHSQKILSAIPRTLQGNKRGGLGWGQMSFFLLRFR